MSVSKACVALLVVSLCASVFSHGQTSRKPLIAGPIDSSTSVTLAGSKHQLVQPRFDVGAVDAQVQFSRIILALTPSAEAQADLQTYMDHQQDRTSPDYHHWLTPEEFGAKFGPAPQDILTVKSWLEQQGLQVTSIAKSGLWMEVSGTSGQVERAFQTQMRQYRIAGEMHIANASELSIPAALTPVVRGVVSLHNFFKKSTASRPVPVKANADGTYSAIAPNATSTTGVHALSPGDYANIYNINPIYATGVNGTGTTIGLAARSDMNPGDYVAFRDTMNLAGSFATNILTLPPDPGFDPNNGDSVEATLDAEWAGAVAPRANIQVIVSGSSATTDGVDLSSAYAVEHNQVDVLSVSFGQCEAGLGPAENAFFNLLWQQAAAQGISVFVSSGDSGSAGCDDPNLNGAAKGGLAVSGLASTPFNTAVGGTEFVDGNGASIFWSSAPGLVSATGYIPEKVWNESCTPTAVGSACAGKNFSIFAGSGGHSGIYPKPVWQTGLPAGDTSRDIPDVSLTAALHDGYLICFNNSCDSGGLGIVGGTSAGSPSFAGIMALVDQSLGGRQGLANYALYRLSKGASASCNSSARTNPLSPAPTGCIFNDVTTGNNSVPGQIGFSATTGYDLATGLGSVNVTNLINAWKLLSAAATTTTLSSNSGSAISAAHGTPVPLAVNVTNPNTPAPSGAVALISNSNGPITVESVPLTASSSTTGTFNGTINDLPGGTYSLTAQYPGDNVTAPSASAPISVTITSESSATVLRTFQVSTNNQPTNPSTSFAYGDEILFQANATAASGHGVPTGSISYTDTSVTPTVLLGVASLNTKGEAQLLVSPRAFGPAVLTPGTHIVKTAYSGDASFTIGTPGTVTLTISKGTPGVVINSGVLISGSPGTISASVQSIGSIIPTGTVQFLDEGVALGNPVTLNAGGATLLATFPNEGSHSITASYSGDAIYNAFVSAAVTVNVGSPFFINATGSPGLATTVQAGQTAVYNLTIAEFNGDPATPNNFSGTVTLSCSGLPAGATCTFNPSSVAISPTQGALLTVSIATSATASLHQFPFRGLPVVFAGVLALALSLKSKRKHAWQAALVLAFVFGIGSCGGGSKTVTPVPTPVPVTHSTIVVTATSGTHTSTVSLQLTIIH